MESKLRAGDAAKSDQVAEPGAGRAWPTGLLLGVQVVLVAASVVLIPFQAMRSAVCDTQCNFDAAETALTVGPIATVSLLILTVIVLAVRGSRSARSWLVVLIGVGLTAAAMFVSNEFFKAALPPL